MNDTDPTLTRSQVRFGPATAEPRTPKTGAEVSELAHLGDPSQANRTIEQAATKTGHGVVWVRPTELIAQATARVAGRGIDFHTELARRSRLPAVQAVAVSRRAISEHARRLPPVSAFGLAGHTPAGATRSGIGLN